MRRLQVQILQVQILDLNVIPLQHRSLNRSALWARAAGEERIGAGFSESRYDDGIITT